MPPGDRPRSGTPRFGIDPRSSSLVTTAQNAAPEQRRLEPDSRALSVHLDWADHSPWAAQIDR
jgi:hypothetical protein